MKTILFIESKPHVRENFIRLLSAQADILKILTAEGLSQAFDILEKIKFDIVLVSSQLSSRDFDLLEHHLSAVKKETRLIILTDKTSQLAKILNAFSHKIQFEVPVDSNLLMDTVLRELGIDTGGSIRGISLPSFLQMLELEGKTCTLTVLSGRTTAFLYFEGGNLIDAQNNRTSGERAALETLVLENCLLSIDYANHGRTRTISAPLMSLLLESGRLKDESADGPIEKRQHPRFQCSFPIEFQCHGREHTGTVRDISIGGIFVECTTQPPSDTELVLNFYSSSLDRSHEIKGKIVRSNSEGFGIEFSNLSLKQKMFLRTVLEEVTEVAVA